MALMDILRKIPGQLKNAQYETRPDYKYATLPDVTIPGLKMEQGDGSGNDEDSELASVQGRPKLTTPRMVADPENPTNVGGGQSSEVVSNGNVRTGRPSFFGKMAAAAPDILRAGIAAAATPNVAGGGAVDVFRGIQAGQGAVNANHDRQRDILRQKQQDEFDREEQQAKIRDMHAQEQERTRKANLPARYGNNPYMNTNHGVFNTDTGQYLPIPSTVPSKVAGGAAATAKAGALSPAQHFIDKGAEPFSPVEHRSVPIASPVPGQDQLDMTVNNKPLPDNHFAVPGFDQGPNQLIMETKEGQDARKLRNSLAVVGERGKTAIANIEARAENRPPPRGGGVPHPSMTEKIKERTQIADGQGLQGEERKQFIMNGRLPTSRPKPSMDLNGFDPFAGAPPPNPATPAAPIANTLPSKGKDPVLPPAVQQGILKRIQAGEKQVALTDPNGKQHLYAMGVDGKLKRLR